MSDIFTSPQKLQDALLNQGYLAGRALSTVVFLAAKLGKPLLVEGPAGVGKTDLARAIAGAMSTELVRLQCYPGLEESKTLYEWNYQQQLLYIQACREGFHDWQELKKNIYTPEFLMPRPLLKAFLAEKPVVLLIDEVDKSDDELESFLLEALSDFQVSIPEIGTVRAKSIPFVLLTSNNTREFGDAFKRRCLYMYIPYPDAEEERIIVEMRVPGISKKLADQVVCIIREIRSMNLRKSPSISETLDWARTLLLLNKDHLERKVVEDTLNAVLKYQEDIEKVRKNMHALIPIDRPEEQNSKNELTHNGRDDLDLNRFDF